MKNISISCLLLLLIVNLINAKPKEIIENDKPCPPSIIKAGYKCCKRNCKVIYTDKDGFWGVEDHNWCGCYNSSTKNIISPTAQITTSESKSKTSKTKTTKIKTSTLTKTVTTTSTTTITKTSSSTTTTEILTVTTEIPTTTTEILTVTTEIPTTTTDIIPTKTGVTIKQNQDGFIGGRDYSLWADDGEVNATFNEDGSFNCSFKNTSNVLCRFGLNFDENKTLEEIDGNIYAKFELAEQKVEHNDYTFVGVYGRNNKRSNEMNLIIEFYVVDYWDEPFESESNVIEYGDFEIDNAEYTIYEKYFSLGRNQAVKQYISYRKEKRTNGTINVSAHLNLFEKVGLKLYGLLEVKVLGETGSKSKSASGFFDFAYSEVYIEQEPVEVPTSTVKEVTVKGLKGGSLDGRDYMLWMGEGDSSATFRSDGSFYCSFKKTSKMMCRYGLDFDQTKTHQEIGQIYAEYDLKENANKKFDYSYVGVYGVSRNVNNHLNPYIEFYVIENWDGQHYPEDIRTINHGEVEIDNAIYTIYEKQITSEDSFLVIKQYVSVRKEKSTSGTVNVSAHLDYWESLGMQLYEIFEIKVIGEVGSMNISASGFFDFTYSNVYVKPTETSSTTTNNTNVSNGKCPDRIIELGFDCCSDDCEVYYTDSDGDWGFENNGWCSCGSRIIDVSSTSLPEPSSTTLHENGNGILGDKYYALWGYDGKSSATFNLDGSFSGTFENTNEVIFHLGLNFDADKPYQELENPIYASFELSKQEVENADYVYAGAYGWIKEEEHQTRTSVEFYIIDQWDITPYSDIYLDSKEYGDYMIDDAMYTVYKNVLEYTSPTVIQYVSVRKEKRTSGTINVSAHIEYWEKLGMKIYGLSDVSVFGVASSKDSKATGIISFSSSNVYVQTEEASSNPNSPSTTSMEPVDEYSECSIKIQEAGYPCCKSGCFILYYDIYGSWGIDKYSGWCGCGNEPINDILPPDVYEVINNPLPPEIKFSFT